MSLPLFLIIWFIIGAVVLKLSQVTEFVLSGEVRNLSIHNFESEPPVIICCITFWPISLGICLLLLGGYGLYKLLRLK